MNIPVKKPAHKGGNNIHAVVIGASAGGINALPVLLNALPADFSRPLIIVIHLSRDQESRLAMSLNRKCPLPVKEADNLETLRPGVVYLAPRNYHLLVDDDLHFSLDIDNPVSFSRPSVDVLFESAAYVFQEHLVGVILTGANADGANGMRTIKKMGGVTIVQDPREARFSAMPLAAMHATTIDYVLPLDEIAPLLARLCPPG